MGCTIFGLRDPDVGEWTFGARPIGGEHRWNEYGRLTRRISLKDDFRWHEVRHLQSLFRKSDIWEDFPARGYTLVSAEVQAGDELQRVDVLYLRNDGAILPCELKIGGHALDPHGQLIRYISDLQQQQVNLGWLSTHHEQFINTITDETAQRLHREKFDRFISNSRIEDRMVRVLPRSGVLVDEEFRPHVLKAVRYLNDYCGFSVRLLAAEAYVQPDWSVEMRDFYFKIELVDVQ